MKQKNNTKTFDDYEFKIKYPTPLTLQSFFSLNTAIKKQAEEVWISHS